MDTDSIVTNIDLPKYLLGNKLGQWKLEYTLKEAVFLAPKVYGGITLDNKEITKVKGYKDIISFEKLKELLILNKSFSVQNLCQNLSVLTGKCVFGKEFKSKTETINL